MAYTEAPNTTQVLKDISSGLFIPFEVELDRGGNWSSEHKIWVDKKLPEFVKTLTPEDRVLVEIMGELGLAVGQLFERQVADSVSGTMYPKAVLAEGGANILLDAAKINPTISDPYSLIPDLDKPAIPYSQAYGHELEAIRRQLTEMTHHNSPSAIALRPYVEALLRAYEPDDDRQSDFDLMHEVDEQWVATPADSPLLFFAEPTEPYLDPARVAHAQKQSVAEWAETVKKEIYLAPWRNFFEFRLLVKDEAMISEDEVAAIRSTSRKLFRSPDDKEVPVSLEFRRLLLASGHGSHPARTAKNYPNFDDIRDNIGYKNVLYTNMSEEAAKTHVIPTLEQSFGQEFVAQFGEENLARAGVRRVVAHEENHPFKRHGDGPLEELKATTNGIFTLVESHHFTDADIQAILAVVIGTALYTRYRIKRAIDEGDTRTADGFADYYRGDTIMMNFLETEGGFIFEDGKIIGLNYKKLIEGFIDLSEHLDVVRRGENNVSNMHDKWGDEAIWDRFTLPTGLP